MEACYLHSLDLAQAERDELGSPPNQELLDTLKPRYWFSAHLHCKFPAIVPHQHTSNFQHQQQQWQGLSGPGGGGGKSTVGQAQAAAVGAGAGAAGAGAAAAAAGLGGGGGGGGACDNGTDATRFLALDKCLPGRDFLQVGRMGEWVCLRVAMLVIEHIFDGKTTIIMFHDMP
jgi:lariat debranching enzyme